MELEVVVIGGLHHNTLGVVRALGEAGVNKRNICVLLIGKDLNTNNFISKSKYLVSSNVNKVSTCEEIIPWLDSLSKDGNKRVIICCSDETAETVIANRDRLNQSYFTQEIRVNIHEFMSKENQAKVAVESGFNVPKGMVIKKDDYNNNWDTYPCIIKPISSIAGGKSDIRILHNKFDLESALKCISSEYVQIQEYIRKKMEYQLIGCSLDNGSIIIIPGYTDIIRQPHNTNTGYLKYSNIKELSYDSNAVDSFIKRIGYSGLFSLEFIRDNEGNDYFLEINMRNDGNAYCVTSAGVNLPYIWCYYQLHKTFPDNSPLSFNNPVFFIPDFSDVKRGIETVGLFMWIKQFLKAESHSVWNKKDMKPFWAQVCMYVKRALK